MDDQHSPWQATITPLTRCPLHDANDVFVVRQLARNVAEAVGLGRQDRVRVATALSEIGRELIDAVGPAVVEFGVELDGVEPSLVVEIAWKTPGPNGVGITPPSVGAAERLLEDVQRLESRIVVRKRLVGFRPGDVEPARAAVAASSPRSALEELRSQNQELLNALDDLQARRDDLLRLNDELQETNQGVLALYAELSQELADTNTGVVALYAELEEKTRQLHVIAETRTRFWANVSHELRTPVNSVIGLARLLLDPAADPLTEEQRRQTTLIESSGATLSTLVNELLDIAKAESGRMEAHLAPVDLVELLTHIHGVMHPVVAPDVTFRLEVGDHPPTLVTDEVVLTRVLRNLLSNALKFTEHGEVVLTAGHDPVAERLVLTVRDTGIGITADQLAQVFEEFYQIPGPLQARSAGTGLGLPYARSLTRLLGGTLTLESTPDVGTTATVRLPLPTAAAAPSGEHAPRVDHALVIDDDPAFREMFRALARPLVTRLVEASDGTLGLALAAEDPPDVIFLDLHMPDPDGFEVMRRLAAHPTLSRVPVVVVTSLDRSILLERVAAVYSLPKAGLTTDDIAHALDVSRTDHADGGAT
ncbi:ATP-binding protein [Embleya scabrispora]|uniref:ATP-binding response regulator n=1 Tax=Embleya scabrispora TaxID=159449 RepID=UPI001914A7CE|nr:ATP-binding protein [Embleya scabrispora]